MDGWVAIMLYFQMVLSSVGVVMHFRKEKKRKECITHYSLLFLKVMQYVAQLLVRKSN